VELYGTRDKRQALTRALMDAGLAMWEGRKDLLAGIDPGYVAVLPWRERPLAQIESDLERMNGVAYLESRQVPRPLGDFIAGGGAGVAGEPKKLQSGPMGRRQRL
jgi:hypothetical protein